MNNPLFWTRCETLCCCFADISPHCGLSAIWSLSSQEDIKEGVGKNIFAEKSVDFFQNCGRALNGLGALPKREFVPGQLPGYPPFCQTQRSRFGKRGRKYHRYLSQSRTTQILSFFLAQYVTMSLTDWLTNCVRVLKEKLLTFLAIENLQTLQS